MTTMRHLAANDSTSRVAVAAFESDVAIWDVGTGQRITSFQTILDFGGRRLAVDPAGEFCVAGAYDRDGLACYNATTGNLIWQRTDLKRVQHVAYSVDGARVLCGLEGGPARALDSRTGAEVGRWRGAAQVVECPHQPWLVVHRRDLELRSRTGDVLAKIPRETFATLDTKFAPGYVMISESGGPVRAFEMPSGRMVWRYEPPLGHHVLRLGVVSSSGKIAGVLYPYQQGGPKQLVLLTSAEGAGRWHRLASRPRLLSFRAERGGRLTRKSEPPVRVAAHALGDRPGVSVPVTR